MLVDCTSESLDVLDPTQGQGQGTPVQFYYTIEDREDSTVTRAVNESNRLADGSKIGLWALWWKQKLGENYIYINNEGYPWDNVNIRNGFHNACYVAKTETTENGNQTINKYLFVPDTNTSPSTIPNLGGLRIFAYYPYKSDLYNNYISPNMPRIDVKAESSYLVGHDASEIEDYLYTGPIEATTDNGSINLTFKHAMAQIQVYVRTTNLEWIDSDDAPRIDSLELKVRNQVGTMSIETGDFKQSTTSSGTSSQRYKPNHILEFNTNGYTRIASFLVFPTEKERDNETTKEKDNLTVTRLNAKIARKSEDGSRYENGVWNTLFKIGTDNTITISKGKVTKVYITINKIN